MLTVILAVLLALAILLIGYLLFLFVDIRTYFKESSYTTLPNPQSEDFFRALVGMSHAMTGNAPLQMIEDSHLFFDTLFNDIDTATRSISIMVYIWETGALSTRLFRALSEACTRGVAVRIMVDYQATKIANDAGYDAFIATGGRFIFFSQATSMGITTVLSTQPSTCVCDRRSTCVYGRSRSS